MATYSFETITAAQALAFGINDTLVLPAGSSAKATTILYLADRTYGMAIGDKTVVFGLGFFVSIPQLSFPDKSILYVGDRSDDVRDIGVLPATGAMYGGEGSDTLTSGRGDWLIQGNQGSDRLIGQMGGANTIYGGQDND